MITVYIIKSLNSNYHYVGISNDLKNRLLRHNSGYNKSTKPYAPFKLIFSEVHKSYKEARKREVFLKSGKGREFMGTIE